MFLQDQFLSLVAAAPTACTKAADPLCVAPTPACQVKAGFCVAELDAKNDPCTDTSKTGFSLGLNMECIADCPDVVTPADPAVNVKGFHSDGKTCIADVAPTDPTKNNDCVPVTDGSTVNLKTQMC